MKRILLTLLGMLGLGLITIVIAWGFGEFRAYKDLQRRADAYLASDIAFDFAQLYLQDLPANQNRIAAFVEIGDDLMGGDGADITNRVARKEMRGRLREALDRPGYSIQMGEHDFLNLYAVMALETSHPLWQLDYTFFYAEPDPYPASNRVEDVLLFVELNRAYDALPHVRDTRMEPRLLSRGLPLMHAEDLDRLDGMISSQTNEMLRAHLRLLVSSTIENLEMYSPGFNVAEVYNIYQASLGSSGLPSQKLSFPQFMRLRFMSTQFALGQLEFMLETAEELEQAASLGYVQGSPRIDAILAELNEEKVEHFLLSIHFQTDSLRDAWHGRALMDQTDLLAKAAIAVQLYYLEHEAYPEHLDGIPVGQQSLHGVSLGYEQRSKDRCKLSFGDELSINLEAVEPSVDPAVDDRVPSVEALEGEDDLKALLDSIDAASDKAESLR